MTTIQFSVVTDAPNVVNKSVTPTATVNGTFRGIADVLNPTIEVVGVDAREYNYCYIPDLERYYFIRHVEITPRGLCKCELHVDVLKTYADQILALNAETNFYEEGNPYSSSAEFGTDIRKVLNRIEFSNPFRSRPQLVLVAIQGGSQNG